MRILQLCKKFPYPLKDGESLAITYLAKALQEMGCSVTMLAMNTRKHFFDTSRLPEELSFFDEIHTVPVDNRIKPLDAFQNLFSRESYHIQRFHTPAFENALRDLLQKQSFGIIQLETLYLAPYIPLIRQLSDAPVVMRAHNVEHEIWDRMARHTRRPLKRWYLKHLTQKLRRYETERLADYDLLLPITEKDLDNFRAMGYRKAALVTPIGIDCRAYHPEPDSFHQKLSAAFIGSLDWMPNREGLAWFLREVWRKASAEFPNLELHVAGRNMPREMSQWQAPNVFFHGEVEDASNFLNQHSLLVVPLLSGSGMRVKILEGMALGKVVLTTEVGLEGIEARDHREVLVANTPEEFIRALSFCYHQNGELQQIGRHARALVDKTYDYRAIGAQLVETYQSLLAGVA